MSTSKKTILIVDDEPPIRRFLSPFLEAEGYAVIEAGSGHEALSLIASHGPDVILLDLGLPDMDGEELLRTLPVWLRAKVIVLSVRSRERDKVTALDLGASDYLTKPFSLGELAARIRVCLRRGGSDGESPPSRYTFGELSLDLEAHVASLKGEDLHLTPTEFKLLAYLARHAGKVVTHSQLLREVWGKQSQGQEHYVRIHIHKLRQKIESDPARPRYLHTETGIGYRLVD
ncbi:two component transcriptional regulator, winged helix family [Solidesulfovibrio carbinoliphilus subsp. oakridgensis]|uniref:Phosphate regulon transcriptional regulatory protein PhoB n=1 Tax=Solidesulfovibrio carbinoliphilus subsp. oakridgensis TaxID=694327 RepID=G7Q7H1_9BACT|nr:response regulator transcription factor [Solidesulfovibrio carbinoliphilus]EHJ47124.1 two component transcriptional regulator, winged helix family [Solidesulfovibrio carbinoliphilus subsp. oakridgensis]